MLNVIEETKMSVEDFAQGLKIMPALIVERLVIAFSFGFQVAATSQEKNRRSW